VFDGARLSVKLASPTGRAAKRLSETTGREATTLHRLLEYDPKTEKFLRGKSRPLVARVVIIDEASMMDVELADSLVQALPLDACLILVGDRDQLPSVGPGAVLHDVIGSGAVPTVRLEHIFRQAAGSLIVENAHRINRGLQPVPAASSEGEFFVIHKASGPDAEEHVAAAVLEIVTSRIPARFGLDPLRDVQVLTPVRKGASGAIALNRRLQAELNPTGPQIERADRIFRLGDRVMQLRNDYDKAVFNGDVGYICHVDVEAKSIRVRYDDLGGAREVDYQDGEFYALGLAYASTIHKSQGSEYPAVVIAVTNAGYTILSRNLVYTAVTRGKQLVVLVVVQSAMNVALSTARREERRTRLAARLRGEAGAPGPRHALARRLGERG
jgi:exodeoxyribonuclease V alpha subunit